MKSLCLFVLIFGFWAQLVSADENTRENPPDALIAESPQELPCTGKWTVTGWQKDLLNGQGVPASIINIPKEPGGTGDYSFDSFFTRFKIEGFPMDIPGRRMLRHTLDCKNGAITMEWVSRRDGSVKKVSFEKVE
ncbi:MAG: hypothetical protein Q8N33_02830 [Rhodocyclaceae bacterium]|nr:hypothetical protein [Rhodocyclaceae bacterium]